MLKHAHVCINGFQDIVGPTAWDHAHSQNQALRNLMIVTSPWCFFFADPFLFPPSLIWTCSNSPITYYVISYCKRWNVLGFMVLNVFNRLKAWNGSSLNMLGPELQILGQHPTSEPGHAGPAVEVASVPEKCWAVRHQTCLGAKRLRSTHLLCTCWSMFHRVGGHHWYTGHLRKKKPLHWFWTLNYNSYPINDILAFQDVNL